MVDAVTSMALEPALRAASVAITDASPQQGKAVEQFRADLTGASPISGDVPGPDTTRLQIGRAEASDNALNKVFDAFAQMDAGYDRIFDSLRTRSTFSSYLEQKGLVHGGDNGSSAASGHSHNFGPEKSPEGMSVEDYSESLKATTREQLEIMAATEEFALEQSRFKMAFEFWVAKMKVLTAVTKQANTGIKTLFQSQ